MQISDIVMLSMLEGMMDMMQGGHQGVREHIMVDGRKETGSAGSLVLLLHITECLLTIGMVLAVTSYCFIAGDLSQGMAGGPGWLEPW